MNIIDIKLTPMDDQQDTGRKLRIKERKHYTDDCLQDEEIEGKRLFSVEEKLVSDQFGNFFVKELKGEDFSLKYLQENGFDTPIIIKDKTGLGMRMPSNNFTVNDVRQCVGSRRILDVMDVTTQKDIEMTMKEWCQYFEDPDRHRLLNVISLEFSHTRLEHYVESPTVVRQVDWVDLVWPRYLKESQTKGTNDIEDMKYPKVQKYCLMSVKGCYTDFHIDFGGTSVWYHIIRGQKVFWLIPPTEENIQLYEQWVLSGKQGDIFFGDTVEKCARIHLYDGYTFFIPTGWIHAVHTPEDSLVFGGNFLHCFGIPKQLRIAQVEDATHVPGKFRYPFYTEILWYVLQRYVQCIKGKNHLTCNDEGDPVKSGFTPNGVLEENGTNPQSVSQKSTVPKQYIHLTQREIEGLKEILVWLQSLPQNKKSVPDLIYSCEALIADVKELVEEHINDDCKLAVTGKPALFWPESKKPRKQRTHHPYLCKQSKPHSDKSGGPRHRRTRCKKCEACRRTDCLECHFCKDMRKYGGPGRMKQSCVSRQCMAPMLPHLASCLLCGQNGWEKTDGPEEEICTLMECSECWEIVHPACIQERQPHLPDGLINDDLPNSWECPKCCHHGKPDDVKPRQMKTGRQRSAGHENTEATSSQPEPQIASPTPVKTYEENSVEENNNIEPPAKKVKTEDLALPDQAVPEKGSDAPQPSAPSLGKEKLVSPFVLLEEKDTKPCTAQMLNLLKEKSASIPNSETSKDKVSPRNSLSKSPESTARQRRIEIGHPPRVTARKHKESTRERLVRSMKGLRKNSELGFVRSKPSPEKPKPSIPNTAIISKCTVNVEKVDVQCLMKRSLIEVNSAANKEQTKEIKTTPPASQNFERCSTSTDERTNVQSPNSYTTLRDRSNLQNSNHVECIPQPEKKIEIKQPSLEQENLCLEKEVMFPVFRYLSHTDLFACQLVCRTWSRWAVDSRLWTRMNVSRRKVTINGLLGIARRQPLSLNLSWTNVSFKQLSWLIMRLPQLKELLLSGCSSIAVMALCSCHCPLIRYLDLRWIDGLTDSMVRDLVSPPKDSKPGFVETRTRLRHLAEIRMSGTDISDVSVRLLAHHLPLLSRLDLSHCHQITDMGIAVLGAAKASRLSYLDVSSCSNITDTSLEALRRCTCLVFLDMRDCSQVTELACDKFARQNIISLKVRDGKLLQKQT